MGDNKCDAALRCYCEEQMSDCGKPSAPVCFARCARCQHLYTVADESLQAHLVIHAVGGVLCGP